MKAGSGPTDGPMSPVQVAEISVDQDGDGIKDDIDNCIAHVNPGQVDSSSPRDGSGAVCVDQSFTPPANANVDPSASVGNNTTIGKNATVGPNAEIGDNVNLKQGSTVGDGTVVNKNVFIDAGASVGAGVTLGLGP